MPCWSTEANTTMELGSALMGASPKTSKRALTYFLSGYIFWERLLNRQQVHRLCASI